MIVVRAAVVHTMAVRIAALMIFSLSILAASNRGWASRVENGTPPGARSEGEIAQQSGDAADRSSGGSGEGSSDQSSVARRGQSSLSTSDPGSDAIAEAREKSAPERDESLKKENEEKIDAEKDSAAPVPAERHRPRRGNVLVEGNEVPCFCISQLARNLAGDQRRIWTTPLRLQARDLYWLAPAALGTFGLVAADNDILRHFGSTPMAHSNSFSNYGLAALVGGGAMLYLRGTIIHDDHAREAGLLAGEAALNGVIVAEAMKFAFERPRPNAPKAGDFGTGGASFPSEHALAAWSIATVIAHEYPGPLTKILAYGAATGISLARVAARDHFPSDVVVGGAIGYLIGRYVYGAHHDADLPGANIGTFEKGASETDVSGNSTAEKTAGRPRAPSRFGSPSVPLDSWVYAAFDRLGALGYAPSAYANLRPWTRMECARILVAAGDDLGLDAEARVLPDRQAENGTEKGDKEIIGNPRGIADSKSEKGAPGEALRLYTALRAEFSRDLARFDGSENSEVGIESVYTRYLGISGTPLADGYHFGQTLIDDFGRPYGPGSNLVSGGSASGSAGPFAFYIRGEYQHAAALPAYSPAVQQMIGAIDVTPPQDPIHTSVLDQVRLLDAYATVNLKTVQISAGRQSLWWGPGAGGPTNLSDNAQPIDMLRLTNPSPWRLPGFLHWLGPMRWDFFAGLMAGHHYPPLPAIDGQKLSFKPTPNLEFGFSRTIVFRPVTLGMFWKGLSSFGDNKTTIPGSAADVGDRRGGLDFSYRLPGLRKWVILYNDGMTDDDTSPLGAPQRSLMSPGIYLPQIPRVPKLDFRAEMAWSDPPALSDRGGRYVYYNAAYRDSYTNDGNLVGSWVGREGHGIQLLSTYWVSPRHPVQIGYRQAHVDRNFIPAGGEIRDLFIRSSFQLRPELEIATFLQYERWNFPVLSPLAGPNTVASIELTYRPRWKKPLNF
jgi:membrane-associated phospholipid phosphatase